MINKVKRAVRATKSPDEDAHARGLTVGLIIIVTGILLLVYIGARVSDLGAILYSDGWNGCTPTMDCYKNLSKFTKEFHNYLIAEILCICMLLFGGIIFAHSGIIMLKIRKQSFINANGTKYGEDDEKSG